MAEELPPVELGEPYRDCLTGFAGRAKASTRYYNDPVELVCLTRASKDGAPEDIWVSQARLERRYDDGPLGFASGE